MKKLMTRVALIALVTFTIGSSISATAAIRARQGRNKQGTELAQRINLNPQLVRLNERHETANAAGSYRFWPWPGGWQLPDRRVFDQRAFRDGNRNDLRDRFKVGYVDRGGANVRGGAAENNRPPSLRIGNRPDKDRFVARRARNKSENAEQANFIARRLRQRDREDLASSYVRNSKLRERIG